MSAQIIPLPFADQPILAGEGTYTGLNNSPDISNFKFINGTGTETMGFAIAGGSNSTQKPTGSLEYPNGEIEAISASWRWETNALDVVQSQWALYPYDPVFDAWGDGVGQVAVYAEEIQAPRSDPLFSGGQQNIAWLGTSSSFDTWMSLRADNQYSWQFSATGDNSGGDGSPLYWYALIDIWIYVDILGNGAATQAPPITSQTTKLGRVELRIINSTP